MNSAEALSRLTDGNTRYITDQLQRGLQDSARRDSVTGGQQPFAIVLSCADSRVVPELVFDTGIGELFVIRVAGNIANTSSIASIEYAVAHLGVQLIVVLGHQSCGAVTAAIAGGDNGHNLNHLVAHLQPAVAACGSEGVDATVREHARRTAEDLRSRSAIIDNAAADGLRVVPVWYLLETGKVEFLD